MYLHCFSVNHRCLIYRKWAIKKVMTCSMKTIFFSRAKSVWTYLKDSLKTKHHIYLICTASSEHLEDIIWFCSQYNECSLWSDTVAHTICQFLLLFFVLFFVCAWSCRCIWFAYLYNCTLF